MISVIHVSQRPTIYRLDVARSDLRDLKGRGPWAVASERSEDATSPIHKSGPKSVLDIITIAA